MADKNENIELLTKCDSKLCVNVLHRLVDGICHRSRPSYDDYSKIWSLQEWWEVSDSLTDLLKNAVKNSWTKDQLFQELGSLNEEYKCVILDIVNSRRADIRKQLLADSHGISQAVLEDFDWKLKLVMSSDKISSVQEPVLSLDMDVHTDTDRRTVSVELNGEELKSLISSLEGANKTLVQLKA